MLHDPRSSNSQSTEARYNEIFNHVQQAPTDVNSWLELVDVAKESKDGDKISRTYKGLLEVFPNTVRSLTPY